MASLPTLGFIYIWWLGYCYFFFGEDIFRIPVESTLISAIIGGGFLGLAGFYYLFNKLDKNTLNA